MVGEHDDLQIEPSPQQSFRFPHGLDATHAPPEHLCVAVHRIPQPPQLPSSEEVSTQYEPHFVYAELHPKLHVDALQVGKPFGGLAGQTCPHEPQLVVLVLKLTHCVPHTVFDARLHDDPHVPSLHVAYPFDGTAHTEPIPPQLLTSEDTSMT